MKRNMNILVIRTHRLGDILQLTPMLRGLKIHYPQSRIYFVTGRDYIQLLQGNPHVDAVIPVPEKEYRYAIKGEPEKHGRIFNELYGLIRSCMGSDFGIFASSITASTSGAPCWRASSGPDGFWEEPGPGKRVLLRRRSVENCSKPFAAIAGPIARTWPIGPAGLPCRRAIATLLHAFPFLRALCTRPSNFCEV